jgi:hypothetical protein
MPRFTVVEAVTGYATTYHRYTVEAPTAAEALDLVRDGETFGCLLDIEPHDTGDVGYGIAEPSLYLPDVCRRADQDINAFVGERDADEWAAELDAEPPSKCQDAWTAFDREDAARRGWVLCINDVSNFIARCLVDGQHVFASDAAAAHVNLMAGERDPLSGWAIHLINEQDSPTLPKTRETT